MGIQINGNTNNINAGIGSLSIEDIRELDITGVATASNFKTGISNLHNLGLTLSGGQLDVGSNIKLGNAGVVTATSFVGSGANLTGISAGAGGDTGLDLNDNVKIRLGTGNDIEFYHSGSHNFIDITNGQLRIRHGTDNAIKTIADGAVILYYDGGQKIQTTTGGIEISGEAVVSGDVKISDSGRLKIGTGQDLEIWHNGGTGNSNIKQQTGDIYFYTGSDLNMHIKDGTSVDLYYANTKVFETTAKGGKFQKSGEVITLLGSTNGGGVYLSFDGASNGDGAGGDHASISHDSSGNFHIKTDNPSSNASIVFSTNGSTRTVIDESGHLRPISTNTYDLGTTSLRWRNIYTMDLHCSNKGSKNDVDGTWGDYTIQEGESDLFLINNRSGKKYKFNLTEVN